MRQALAQARAAKAAEAIQALPEAAGSADVDRGPTTLPGENPGYGRNYNPVPEANPAPAAGPEQAPAPEPKAPEPDRG
jgi:hypothetical protein